MTLGLSFYSIIFFLSAFIYLYWGIYLIRIDPKEKVNQVFFALILAVFTWSVGYALSNSSMDIRTALFWRKMASVGRMSLFSIILHFMLLLTYTKEELNKKWLLILIHVPAILLVYVFAFSDILAPLQYNLMRFDYGWINKPADNIWNRFYYLYFITYILISLLLVIRWKRKLKSTEITKQANLIIVTIAIAFILGGILDFIPSLIFKKPLPQMASIFILLPVWAMYNSARYFGLFKVEIIQEEDKYVTGKEQKKIFINIAIAIFISGVMSIISDYLMFARAGNTDIGIPLQTGGPLLAIGLILVIIQKIEKESFRETLNIIVLLASIPIVAILYLKYSAVTVWVLPIIIILSSLLFSNRTLLISTTFVAIGTQRLIWIIKPELYVVVNRFDYITRILIILTAYFIGSYINRIYIAKIKENNYQIEFQQMISDISLDFVSLNQENFKEKVNDLLAEIGNFFNADKAYLFNINYIKTTLTCSNEWNSGGISEKINKGQEVSLEAFPWWMEQLNKNNLVYIDNVDNMSKESSLEQEYLHRKGVKSLLSVPIMGDSKIQAFIGIESVSSTKKWSEENIDRLNIIANILSSGIVQLKADKKIEFMAYYDNLTKLPNRFLFEDRVNQAINLSERTEKIISIIFLDLDNFKSVNDTIGHKGGDFLLKEVAKKLLKTLRKTDTVARFGGDEFMILLNNVSDYEKVIEIADKIMKIFSETFLVNGQEFLITASAGIAIYPIDGLNSETLVKNADIAMYRAKSDGKNQFALCTNDMKTEVQTSIDLSNDLYRALDRNELIVYYQPQVDLLTKKITGVEALLRWQHPTKGMISPGVFIPIAEKNGLINRIGEWVFKTACQQNKKWQDMGLPHMNIAINISAIQIINPKLPANLENIIKEIGLNPKYIELEITESIAIKETNYVIDLLNKLKEIGVSIAIDDFGTEYSSLSRLKLLPIDRIKIDMQFVQGLETNEKDKAITMVIINLGKSLGLNVLAEGVETKTQLDFLNQKMCDNVQGYFYYKPMPAHEMEKILIDLYESEDKNVFEYININPKLITE